MSLLARRRILDKVSGTTAGDVIARMTSLTTQEEVAITNYVEAEDAAANWTRTDEFFAFGFILEANALTGWISKTATNVGSTTKTIRGFDFDGSTQHLNSNF